jgi:hypothetical protein
VFEVATVVLRGVIVLHPVPILPLVIVDIIQLSAPLQVQPL